MQKEKGFTEDKARALRDRIIAEVIKIVKGCILFFLLCLIVLGALFILSADGVETVKECAIRAFGGTALFGLSLIALAYITEKFSED